jgi:hypothetical protein
MRRRVPGDKMRRPATHAIAQGGVARRSHHGGIVRKTEIIVACKREQRAALEANVRTLRRIENAARSRKPLGAPAVERALELGDRRNAGIHPGTSPSLANRLRSASTSGLPVVNSFSP